VIAVLAVTLSVLIVIANVALVAFFVLRWDRRAGQPLADRHDQALTSRDAG
jgi:hypothetical protein